MEEQNENKQAQDRQEVRTQLHYERPKIISRRRFLVNTGLIARGATVLLAGSGAVFYQAALQNKSEGKGIQKPDNNLVLIGDKTKFDNLTELTKVVYLIKIHDAWVTRNIEGMVYVNKDQSNQLIVMSLICTYLGCRCQWHRKRNNNRKRKSPIKEKELLKKGIKI